eukprot:TRINITY_DN5525_c0_g1_i2.p1 TRINITY_DN5525_c0_g1~~TRINITY_DN5525_c0_g1_i2.p1  ORF type:complete len:288 (+),score=52.24 TRINITY_DN5525_c0_g1_i2:393-1256(+)
MGKWRCQAIWRFSYACRRLEEAQGYGICGNPDRVWIGGAAEIAEEDLDAVGSPRASTVSFRLEEATGLAFRFVIGRTTDRSKMLKLRKEVAEYDDFMLLDIEEEYSKLPYKTIAFFKAAYALFDSDFYVKADDDIYLRPDRLSLLVAKERSHPLTYLGCMKKGPVFTNPNLKWYEPLSHLLGSEYFLHAYGPIYALSADVVATLVTLRNNSFRMFSNEDVTIGAWMLAMNVNHEHNQALCSPDCTPSSIAVWDIPKCSGLCNPEEQLLSLHQKESCSKAPILASSDG